MGNVVEQMENFIREVETLKYNQMEILELKKRKTPTCEIKNNCLALID